MNTPHEAYEAHKAREHSTANAVLQRESERVSSEREGVAYLGVSASVVRTIGLQAY